MGEKSGPVPWVTCASDLSLRVYFQMLVRPLTVRLNSTVLPGSPQARSTVSAIRRRLIAQVAIFFQRLINDVFEFGGKFGIQAHRSDRSAIQNRVSNHAGSFTAKRNRAGGHFIQDHAKGK